MSLTERELLAIRLESAVMSMASRYGESTQQYAYALNDHADERARHLRAVKRRYRALYRLARALSDLVVGGAR